MKAKPEKTLLEAELNLLSFYTTILNASCSLAVGSAKYARNRALLAAIEEYINAVHRTKGITKLPGIRSVISKNVLSLTLV